MWWHKPYHYVWARSGQSLYGERQCEHTALHVHFSPSHPSLWANFSTRHRKFYAGTGYESKFAHEIKKLMRKITSIRPTAALWAVCGGRFQNPPHQKSRERNFSCFSFIPRSRSGLIFDEKWAVHLFFEPAGANVVNKIPK